MSSDEWDEDLLRPTKDARAAEPTMAELTAMKRTYDRVKALEREIRARSVPPVSIPHAPSLKPLAREIAFPEPESKVEIKTEQLEETFKKLGESMIGVGVAANKAMTALMQLAMAPHRGGWIESMGWVCERCGAESMDLDIMREVPCGRGD